MNRQDMRPESNTYTLILRNEAEARTRKVKVLGSNLVDAIRRWKSYNRRFLKEWTVAFQDTKTLNDWTLVD